METTHVMLEGKVIALTICRHPRARRISMRPLPARDGVVLTLPKRAPIEAAMQFFAAKSEWVLATVQSFARIAFVDGSAIPVLGKQYRIRHLPGRGVSHLSEASSELVVYGDAAFVSRRVQDFLKKHLQEVCFERAQSMAAQLGKTVRNVAIRDTRTRWGSCSHKGTLALNWRLVFAPLPALDYLIAHEVSHLAEMNHSDRFWRRVGELCPDFQTGREWMKHEGHTLHRYG